MMGLRGHFPCLNNLKPFSPDSTLFPGLTKASLFGITPSISIIHPPISGWH